MMFRLPSAHQSVTTRLCCSLPRRPLLLRQACRTLTASASPVDLPPSADVVVCGGGLVGCAVAYSLAKTNIRNVVLVEQVGNAHCGATQHCSKFFTHGHPTRAEIIWSQMSRQLYSEVDPKFEYWFDSCTAELDQYHRPKGSFTIASTPNRAIENLRKKSLLAAAGINSKVLTAHDLRAYFPTVNTGDIENVLWIPSDVLMNATKIRKTLLNAALSLGVKYFNDCKVIEVKVGNSNRINPKVVGVETERGYISTPVFVNCAGSWASEIPLSNKKKLNVCVGPCYVSTLTSKPVVDKTIYPYIWHDPDEGMWMLQDDDRLVLSGINAGHSLHVEDLPKDLPTSGLQPCVDHVHSAINAALKRFPGLQDFGVENVITSLDSFSYDSKITVGEVESVTNYYVVSGMHASGLMFAGAAAKILQSLLDRYRTQFNLTFINPSRFSFANNNQIFRQTRTSEISHDLFSLRPTTRDFHFNRTCRGFRVSPLFDSLKEYKAVFGCQCGFEWPLFFDKDEIMTDKNRLLFSNQFREPHYNTIVEKEYRACHDSVGVADMSGFVKLIVESSRMDNTVEQFLQRVCCTAITSKNMHVTRFLMLNRLGTYECDAMIARLDNNKFMIVGPCLQTSHCDSWLRRQLRNDADIIITDISAQYGVLNVIGPMAPKLLERLTGEHMSPTNFPSSSIKRLNVDIASNVLTMRVSYTGEDGFTLFVPSREVRLLHDRILDIGAEYGIMNVGYFAIKTLRIEHGIDYWGSEISQRVNPLECNKGRLIQMSKEFKGRNALIDTISNGVRQRLIKFIVENTEIENAWPAEGDPIYESGTVRGFITSSTYSFNRKKHIVLGFLMYNEVGQLSYDQISNREYFLEVCGERRKLIPTDPYYGQ